jgi:NADH-quinone oxidoreductase subunit N
MNQVQSITRLDLVLAAPEIFLLAAICVILLVDLFLSDRSRWVTFLLSLLALAGVSWLAANSGVDERTVAWRGAYVADPVGNLLKIVASGALAVVFLYSRDYLRERGLLKGEFFVLGLFALLGIMVLVSANSLLTLYLGVELQALALYALVAYDRDSGVAAESAIKYFVLGSIASGALLYGMSILYGVTGSLELGRVSQAVLELGGPNQIGLLFGLSFVVVGVAFKFGAVPFHMWVPDVYHGAPTAVTLLLSSAPKLASFALAYRLLAEGLAGMLPGWQDMLVLVSVLSMAIGNVVAIAQTNLKRMLAYSTISHVGFILLGILAGTSEGYQAALYYTITYVIMSVGGFGMIILLSRRGFEADVQHGWSAAVRRVLGQAGRDPGRAGRGLPVARHRGRRAVGDRGVLLPAGRQADVFRRASGNRRAAGQRGLQARAEPERAGRIAAGCVPRAAARAVRPGARLNDCQTAIFSIAACTWNPCVSALGTLTLS